MTLCSIYSMFHPIQMCDILSLFCSLFERYECDVRSNLLELDFKGSRTCTVCGETTHFAPCYSHESDCWIGVYLLQTENISVQTLAVAS